MCPETSVIVANLDYLTCGRRRPLLLQVAKLNISICDRLRVAQNTVTIRDDYRQRTARTKQQHAAFVRRPPITPHSARSILARDEIILRCFGDSHHAHDRAKLYQTFVRRLAQFY
jgi:nitrate reductase cytochrome c-type subunit